MKGFKKKYIYFSFFLLIFTLLIVYMININRKGEGFATSLPLDGRDIEEIENNSYSIKKMVLKITGENFPEDSHVFYPQIDIKDEPQLTKKVNDKLYEVAMENYEPEILSKVNASYDVYYIITFADASYVSVYYNGTIAGGGGHRNFGLAVTIDLETGNTMCLSDFGIFDDDVLSLLNKRDVFSAYKPTKDIEYWNEFKTEMCDDWK